MMSGFVISHEFVFAGSHSWILIHGFSFERIPYYFPTTKRIIFFFFLNKKALIGSVIDAVPCTNPSARIDYVTPVFDDASLKRHHNKEKH